MLDLKQGEGDTDGTQTSSDSPMAAAKLVHRKMHHHEFRLKVSCQLDEQSSVTQALGQCIPGAVGIARVSDVNLSDFTARGHTTGPRFSAGERLNI